VVARDKAHRQTGRSVQTPGRDQIGFLRRAIKRHIARVQHQVGTGLRNVACNLAEIGEAMGDEAFCQPQYHNSSLAQPPEPTWARSQRLAAAS
jgi:hypothetical protein